MLKPCVHLGHMVSLVSNKECHQFSGTTRHCLSDEFIQKCQQKESERKTETETKRQRETEKDGDRDTEAGTEVGSSMGK